MKTVALVARIVLGLVFTVFGANGFLEFIHAPPMSGLQAAFVGSLNASHYSWLVAGAQLLGGVLLLTNQYLRFALVLLGAVIANIVTFHATMQPQGLPLALVVVALWIAIAWPERKEFGTLFARRTSLA